MITSLTERYFPDFIIPTERRGISSVYFAAKWKQKQLLQILTSGPPRAGRASFYSLLRMTGLTDCHFPSFVIPTEKPRGFDEESPVYTTQSSEVQSTYSRSSRRSFHSLLRMTSLTDCHSPKPVIPTEKPRCFDEESLVCTTRSSITRSSCCRSSRCFAPQDDSINGLITPLSITGLEDCNF